LQQAEAGDVHAQLFVAHVTRHSKSTESRSLAVRWYEMAANQGNLCAMLMLYRMYQIGHCVEVDLPKACDWMRRIVTMYDDAKNDVQRNAIRDVMHRYGMYLLGGWNPCNAASICRLPDDLQDPDEGVGWLEKAADLGNKDAIVDLASLYITGYDSRIGLHVEKGMEWYKKGAQIGSAECALQLASAYKRGAVPVNPRLEKQWLKVAARLGSNEGRVLLSMPELSLFDTKKEVRKQLRHLDKEKNIDQYLGTDQLHKCFNPSCDRTDTADAPFESCSKCQYVKYCSIDCQLVHWKEGHKSVCKYLEKYMKERKERAKEATMRCLENLDAALAIQCYFCQKEADETTTLRRCSKCKVPKYCSTECQVNHWKSVHKEECTKATREFYEAQEIIDRLDAQNGPSQG
jgi:TPR repeat protein